MVLWLLIFFLFFFLLCWIFIAVLGFSLVVASGDYSSLQYMGFSLWWLLLLQSMGSRRAGSVVVAHGLCSLMACGIFPDQGLNPCPLHWQVDCQPLDHQGSPCLVFSYWVLWVLFLDCDIMMYKKYIFAYSEGQDIFLIYILSSCTVPGSQLSKPLGFPKCWEW